MSIFLTTYRPLVATPAGRKAIGKYGFPPFIDDSCRREPDFESPYPSISALCHGDKFVPRVKEGDTVVFITKQGRYLGIKRPHWRLVAILRVLHAFGSHPAAAEWYRSQNLVPPANCMIPGSVPLSLDKTRIPPYRKGALVPSLMTLAEWNGAYNYRARKTPRFLVCSKDEYIDLVEPKIITHEMMISVFGYVRGTQNPPAIEMPELIELKRVVGIA